MSNRCLALDGRKYETRILEGGHLRLISCAISSRPAGGTTQLAPGQLERGRRESERAEKGASVTRLDGEPRRPAGQPMMRAAARHRHDEAAMTKRPAGRACERPLGGRRRHKAPAVSARFAGRCDERIN
jgi:hypothetical protein